MKLIAAVVFLFSLLFVIGSAGAIDMNRVGLLQGTLQMVGGLAVMWGCVLLMGQPERGGDDA